MGQISSQSDLAAAPGAFVREVGISHLEEACTPRRDSGPCHSLFWGTFTRGCIGSILTVAPDIARWKGLDNDAS